MRAVAATALLLLAHGAPAEAQTVQQQFEAGQAALNTGRIEEALAIYTALEARVAKGPPTNLAAVRVRLAEALVGRGEYGRAEEMLNAALPLLDGRPHAPLRFDALRTLGSAEESTLQFAAAQEHYRAALRVPGVDSAAALAVAAQAARVAIFSDPARAARELEALLGDAQAAQFGGEQLAAYWGLLARARLNAGDLPGARTAVERAISLAGGLTARVSQTDLAIRGDAAIIAWKLGNQRRAAEYLGYTGAGLLGDGGKKTRDFTLPRELSLPPCGGPDDLRPEDEAVVQFTLSSEGQVVSALPVWSSRQGPGALAYVRSVSDWLWDPKDAAAIHPFFRIAPRIQLRCTTAPERVPPTPLLLPALTRWAAAAGVEVAERPQGANFATEERRLRARLAGADAPERLGALVALAALPTVNRAEAQALLTRAVALMARMDVPAEARAWLGVRRAAAARNRDGNSRRNAELEALEALVGDRAIAADPRARGYVLLVRADLRRARNEPRQAQGDLGEILGSTLAADDPIRQAAAVRMASFAAAADDTDSAQRWFAQSGVDPSQCSLIDAEPVLLTRSASFKDYPEYAISMESVVVVEFDIDAAGRTQGVRPVVAYPPLLFAPSATAIASRSRYAPTYRPAGVPGCRGYRHQVRYAPSRLAAP